MVNVLSDRLEKPDPGRAAEAQMELLRFFERAKDKGKVAAAKLDLGRLYSAARYDQECTTLWVEPDLAAGADRKQ